MEIWLKNDDLELRLPINPSTIEYNHVQNNQEVEITNFGTLNLVGKSGLLTTEISSTFPATDCSYNVQYKGYPSPKECVNIINKLKLGKLRLVVTGTVKNMSVLVTIETFTYKEDNITGDIKYTIELKQYRKPTYTKTTSTKKTTTTTDNITVSYVPPVRVAKESASTTTSSSSSSSSSSSDSDSASNYTFEYDFGDLNADTASASRVPKHSTEVRTLAKETYTVKAGGEDVRSIAKSQLGSDAEYTKIITWNSITFLRFGNADRGEVYRVGIKNGLNGDETKITKGMYILPAGVQIIIYVTGVVSGNQPAHEETV